jgi:hypothetical protein
MTAERLRALGGKYNGRNRSGIPSWVFGTPTGRLRIEGERGFVNVFLCPLENINTDHEDDEILLLCDLETDRLEGLLAAFKPIIED